MSPTPADRRREPEFRHPALDYKPPRYLAVIRYSLLGGLGTAVLCIAYTAFWFYTATSLRTGIEDWFADRRAEGYAAAFERAEISGFPFLLRVVLSSPRIDRAAAAGTPGWHWRSARAVVEVPPWSFSRVRVDLAGDLEVGLADGAGRWAATGSARRLEARLRFRDGTWPVEAALAVSTLALGPDGAASSVAAGRFELRARRLFPSEPSNRTPSFTLALDAADLTLPGTLALPLGNRIRRLALDLAVLGPVGGGSLSSALRTWRDDGGTVELRELGGLYGSLDFRASGTLALDGDMQPIGAVTARLEGFFPAVDRLRDAGLIRSRDASMAKLVLGALARRPAGGGQPALSVPLTIQDHKFYAGPVALLDIPPIPWPKDDAPAGGFEILR